MSEESKDKVISFIKSCLAIGKQNLTLDQLHDDYKQLVQGPIPFRTFGHGTLESFVRSVPKDFKVVKYGGITYVKSMSSPETEHIEKLVKNQKQCSTKKSNRKSNIRKPHKPSSWNGPRYYPNVQNRGYRSPGLLPTPRYSSFHQGYNAILNHWKPAVRSYPPVSKVEPSFHCSSVHVSMSNMSSPTSQVATTPHYSNVKPKSIPIQVSPKPIAQEAPTPNKKLPGYYKKCLIDLAKDNGIDDPQFCTTQGGGGKKPIYFLSVVKVANKQFLSYPEEKTTTIGAEDVAAANALEGLKDVLQSSAVKCTTDPTVVAERIKQILLQKNEGVWWWNYLQKEYLQQFKESLPADWLTAAQHQSYAKGIVFQLDQGDWTLCLAPVEEPIKEEEIKLVNGNGLSSLNLNNGSICAPKPLKFPEEKMLSVYITVVKNCNEVWLRIIEDEYNEAFEDLITEMEMHYMVSCKTSKAEALTQGEFYACSNEDSCYRVQLLEVNGENANVSYIDQGDREIVPTSSLHELLPRFLELPCQAIKVQLVGMEYGYHDFTVLAELQNYIGKSLVAEVLFHTEDAISVVLYDTSTEVDININEKLLKLNAEKFLEPSLPVKGNFCEVYLSHVTSDGIVYVHIEAATFKTLQELLVTARKRTAEILGNETFDIDINKLYLAKFSPEGEWYRVAPRMPSTNKNEEVVVYAIDFGIRKSVPASSIIPLAPISEILCKIPPQAIPVKLHQVPSSQNYQWTSKVSDRLLSIIPTDGEPVLLKVIESASEGNMALVQIYTRVQPQNVLVSINVTLDRDASLFSEDKNNNIGADAGETTTNGLNLSSDTFQMASNADESSTRLPGYNKPPIESIFDVYVTYAASPFNFKVQAMSSLKDLNKLMAALVKHYSKEPRQPLSSVETNKFYAVLHTDGDWYRSRIQSSTDELVTGTFVDFGNCFCCPIENVQPLTPEFLQLPCQSFKAKLNGIEPLNGDWTPEDCFYFRKMVEDKAFVAIVKRIENDEQNSPILFLKLIDTSNLDVDVNLADHLVEAKCAKNINLN